MHLGVGVDMKRGVFYIRENRLAGLRSLGVKLLGRARFQSFRWGGPAKSRKNNNESAEIFFSAGTVRHATYRWRRAC